MADMESAEQFVEAFAWEVDDGWTLHSPGDRATLALAIKVHEAAVAAKALEDAAERLEEAYQGFGGIGAQYAREVIGKLRALARARQIESAPRKSDG